MFEVESRGRVVRVGESKEFGDSGEDHSFFFFTFGNCFLLTRK